MTKKCIGCGAVLQYTYPSIEGYVKKKFMKNQSIAKDVLKSNIMGN